MKSVLEAIKNVFRFHKMKIFAIVVFAFIFVVLLFPYDDISDLATTKIAEASGGALFVQFDNLNLNLGSKLGFRLENVVIESAMLPPVNAESVILAPWLAGALSARMGGSMDAEGIFKGNLSVDFQEGDKLKSGIRAQNIEIQAGRIALPALTDFLRSSNLLSLDLQGLLDLNSSISVDPGFETQPHGTIGVKIDSFTFPEQSVAVQQFGQIPIPTLKFSKVSLQGKLNEGRLEIEDLSLGGPKDEVIGKIKGELGLSFRRGPAGVQPVIGASDLRIDLTASNAMLKANESSPLGLVFKFFDACKKPAGESTKFIFRMKGNNPIPECIQSI